MIVTFADSEKDITAIDKKVKRVAGNIKGRGGMPPPPPPPPPPPMGGMKAA